MTYQNNLLFGRSVKYTLLTQNKFETEMKESIFVGQHEWFTSKKFTILSARSGILQSYSPKRDKTFSKNGACHGDKSLLHLVLIFRFVFFLFFLALGSEGYFFITITPRQALNLSSITCLDLIHVLNIFENLSRIS